MLSFHSSDILNSNFLVCDTIGSFRAPRMLQLTRKTEPRRAVSTADTRKSNGSEAVLFNAL